MNLAVRIIAAAWVSIGVIWTARLAWENPSVLTALAFLASGAVVLAKAPRP